ncbi:hypothetical protein Bpfe_004342 [Biomphalaria pfeifferi]|uniref:Uncharacterized protein n=1 Tax=Biomphalaria pfeifferi TaxID=112525 RepID=A0AAD8C499_BIOPF|nr:hypothetical protein Bpfe_004342 [Biomphalaria pfeifferi]
MEHKYNMGRLGLTGAQYLHQTSHWVTPDIPLGHTRHPIGSHQTSHWVTPDIPMGHTRHPIGSHQTSHWVTPDILLCHTRHPIGSLVRSI